MDEGSEGSVKKEICTYRAPWLIYAANWSYRPDKPFRLAIGSFREDYTNKVEIIQLNESKSEFEVKGSFDHPYPTTKLAWLPDKTGTRPDLLATTGDFLRIWRAKEQGGAELKALLNNQEKAITQLIAHDKEVYDIAFARGTDVFASVGADGSVRMFDLRSLEHSTIIYETPDLTSLLRLAWNKQDPNYLATMMTDSSKAIILDIRVPSLPAAELLGHSACLNSLVWAPHSSCHICTAADDRQTLIWDLAAMPKPVQDPILAYSAEAAINQVQWSATHPDWIAIAFAQSLQILRV